MSKIQLHLDFARSPKAKATSNDSVNCQVCALPINLEEQRDRDIKGCPHCGDRTWLLNLKTAQAAILYGIKAESLGGRLRKD